MRCSGCGASVSRESEDGDSLCANCRTSQGGREESPGDTNSDADELLGRLVQKFEEALERGEDPPIEDWCSSHGEISVDLRKALEVSRQLQLAGFGSSKADENRVPSQLGSYRIVEELGRGGNSSVFHAVDERSEQPVALKVLAPSPFGATRQRERFLREARALARIRHPQVVPILDVGEDGPFAYIAMALMERSLHDVIDGSDDPAGAAERRLRAARWIAEACDGLSAAHAQGVLHRDVKPSNLLLGADGRLRVGDFGLAHLADAPELTKTGQAMGTPGYIAPELLMGGKSSLESEIYGLGATLYALVSGAPPDLSDSGGGLFPPPCRQLGALEPILRRALAPRARDRYPDADALAAALRRFLRVQEETRGRRSVHWIWLVALVLAVCAAGTIGWWIGHDGPESTLSRAVSTSDSRNERRPGGFSIWHGNRHDFDVSGHVTDRMREAGFDFDRLTDGAHSKASLEIRALDGRYRVEIAPAEHYVAVELLYQPGNVQVAEFLATLRESGAHQRGFTSSWELHERTADIDGDGLPETFLVRREGPQVSLYVLKWEPNGWGLPDRGWRRRVEHRFEFGSPILCDWDGDERLEIIFADAGRDIRQSYLTGHSMLYVLDALSGERERSWMLKGTCRSTPQPYRSSDGRVTSIYLDVEDEDELVGGRHLYRVEPTTGERPAPLPLPESKQRMLTWPVFHDVDGDGSAEILIGGQDGRFYCLNADEPSHQVWSYAAPSAIESYPLLIEASDEVCFVTTGAFTCLATAPELPQAERVTWTMDLEPGEMYRNQPVLFPDLDGDGAAEIAIGSNRGRVLVLTKRGPRHIFADLGVPESAMPPHDQPFWPYFAARPALLQGSREGSVLVIGASIPGWVFGWRLGAESSQPCWTIQAHGRITASPVILGTRLLTADYGGWILLHELEAEDPCAQPRLVWSYQAEAGIGSTPATFRVDGAWWAAFTDHLGHITTVPISSGTSSVESAGTDGGDTNNENTQ